MSGFDLASMLPFYLDEVDEQIAALNETLLRLEAAPDDEPALRDAFRLVHTIKGSSSMMGFEAVRDLTHQLETIFDQLRGRKRTLDRPFLDLCFRSLDALRDYHRDVRAGGQSDVDLAALTAAVVAQVDPAAVAAASEAPGSDLPDPVSTPGSNPPEPSPVAVPTETAAAARPGEPEALSLFLRFEPNLQWADMKAKLVLNRLAAKGRILATEPASEQLEEVESLTELRIWLVSECDLGELHAVADVDGVAEIRIESAPWPGPRGAVAAPRAPDPAIAPPALSAGDTADALDAAAPSPVPPPEPVSVPSEPSPIPGAATTTSVSPPAPGAGAKPPRVTETVRVDVERLDQLMNLAGELVINKARFAEIARGLEELFRTSSAPTLAADTLDRLDALASGLSEPDAREPGALSSRQRWDGQLRRLRENFRAIQEELDLIRQGREQVGAMAEAINHLSRVSDGIQRGVLETRMVPIGPLFDRFHRVIRDLRISSSKEVELRIEGEKTELDKRMIDELGDPLIHLVRNSVDHGLEPPAEREAAGKRRAGTVALAASHRGNSIVITVSDDGRGIDCERVRRKAVARGLIGESESRLLNDRQLMSYIWHPGLSTAEAVTEISGRGVGMDIVKSRIESLSGTVDLRSEPGQGTTFIIRLPLTLAIMSVLLVRVGQEFYCIPLDHLSEIVAVSPGQVYRLHGQRSIEIRGRIISLLALDEILHRGGSRGEWQADEGAELAATHTVVIVSNGETTIGLIVDQLLGLKEAVLKSLEKNFRPVPGLSGASILGDGRVSLILDIDGLIGMVAVAAAGV